MHIIILPMHDWIICDLANLIYITLHYMAGCEPDLIYVFYFGYFPIYIQILLLEKNSNVPKIIFLVYIQFMRAS